MILETTGHFVRYLSFLAKTGTRHALPLLHHQLMYPGADSLTYLHMSTMRCSTPQRPGWPPRKRSAVTLVEVSQHAFMRFFYYVRYRFVPYASPVLQCTPDVIFSSAILCWINPPWVLSPMHPYQQDIGNSLNKSPHLRLLSYNAFRYCADLWLNKMWYTTEPWPGYKY